MPLRGAHQEDQSEVGSSAVRQCATGIFALLNVRRYRSGVAPHQIVRQSIAFGPEVTPEEEQTSKTASDVNRGLAFVCYQSAINKGFAFLQKSECPCRPMRIESKLTVDCAAWVNNTSFPPHPISNPIQVGFDPISELQSRSANLPK